VESVVAGWLAGLGEVVIDDVTAVAVVVWVSCWNLRISASFLWWPSRSLRVRRAWVGRNTMRSVHTPTPGTGRSSSRSFPDLPHGPSCSEGQMQTRRRPSRVPHWRRQGLTCGSRGQHFAHGCGPGEVRAGELGELEWPWTLKMTY
jgi:hypothetical protein